MSIKSDPPQSPKYLSQLLIAMPWFVLICGLILVNHAVHTQTLAQASLAGTPEALAFGKWLWLTVPAACAGALLAAVFNTDRNRWIATAVGLVLPPLLGFIAPVLLLPLLLLPIAVILMHVYFSIKESSAWRPGLFAGALITLILAYAAHKRQDMFFLIANRGTDPDFESYLIFARDRSGWATMFREPFYIWILQLADKLGGELNPVMVRLTSIATALGAVAAIFELCRRHLNLTVAVIAALLYAGQKYMIYTAVRGLRDDTVVFTGMLFLSVAWSHLKGSINWKSLTMLGLLGAACSLLRISSFSFVLAVMVLTAAFRFYRDKWTWRPQIRWLLPIALTVGLMVPYLLHCKKEYGQAFFVVNYAARYYANEEFGGKRPDFPTQAELAKDAYAGPPITPREYIFNYHSLGEIVERTWDGFVKTFFGSTFKLAYNMAENPGSTGVVYILHFAGLALLLFPRKIYLVICMLAFHAPMFFLAQAPSFDPRLVIMAMAFAYITVAAAIGISLQFGWRYLRTETVESPKYGTGTKQTVTAKSKPKRKGAPRATPK